MYKMSACASPAFGSGGKEALLLSMPKTFGQWLKEMIDRRGLSQRQFAIAVEKTPSHISQVINDQAGLSPELVRKIADVLGIPRKDVLDIWVASQSEQSDGEITYEDADDQAALVETYRELTPIGRETLKVMAERLKEAERRYTIGARASDKAEKTGDKTGEKTPPA